jgi:hypothetical protein
VTGIEARYRACAQLQPDELWRHSLSYGDNKFLMATIKRPMANIQIAYGGNHIALWRKLPRAMATLFRYGENSLEGDLQWRELTLYCDGRFFR